MIDNKEDSKVLIREDEEIAAEVSHEKCLGCSCGSKERDSVEHVPSTNPVKTTPRYIFPCLSQDDVEPPSIEEMRKISASFMSGPEEYHAPYVKVYPMGVGVRSFPNLSNRFTGRGGEVHKVSEEGFVLDELVDPSSVDLLSHLRIKINAVRSDASSLVSLFREKILGYFDGKLEVLEKRLRPFDYDSHRKNKNRRGFTSK